MADDDSSDDATRRRIERACVECGLPTVGSTWRKYCSSRCRQRARYSRQNARDPQPGAPPGAQRAVPVLRADLDVQLAGRLGMIVEASTAWIWTVDLLGTITYANAAVERILGYRPEEVVGRKAVDLIHPDSRDRLDAALRHESVSSPARSGEQLRWRHRDGSDRYLECWVTPLRDGRRQAHGLAVESRDVTAQRLATLLAGGQQDVLELVATGAPLATCLAALALVVEAQDDGNRLCSVLLLDDDRVHLRHGAAPSLPESYNRLVDGLPIGPNVGSCGTAAFTGEPVVAADISTDPHWVGAAHLALDHGLRACWSSPILDGDRRVLGTFAVYHRRPWSPTPEDRRLIDAATHLARVAIERQRAQDALREAERSAVRAERLRALGQMAGGIAHDLNQSLTLAVGYGDLLMHLIDSPSPDVESIRDSLAIMHRGTVDAGETAKRLLTYARPHADTPAEVVNLNALLFDVQRLTAPRWRDMPHPDGHTIVLEVEPSPVAVAVAGCPTTLREALTNLVFNAVEALPSGGTIRLASRLADDRAELTVEDNGLGMPDDVRDRMFEPFFTTKGSEGTGLGLVQVQTAVTQHNGEIHVQTTPGGGTTFRLTFPLAAIVPSTERPTEVRTPALPPSPSRRILAVDDDPRQVAMARMLLERRGHHVGVASSGEEALQQLTDKAFDVVVSDLDLGGGINGWALARAVRSGWPSVRFVLASGWGDGIDLDAAGRSGVDVVVAKPYRLAALAQAVLEPTRDRRNGDRD